MVKNLIRSAFRFAGIDIRRYLPETAPELQLRTMLANHDIDLVLDIGANTGQFALELRHMGFKGRIVSFEPVAAAHKALATVAAKDPLWEIAPRMAIGSKSGSITVNVSGNSVSSSVLPILSTHTDAAPGSRYVSQEVVPLETLDVAARNYVASNPRAFVKIDTQGYESEVLTGAPEILSKAQGIQMELSLVPLYRGQVLIKELWNSMSDAGFELWAVTPVFVEPHTGQLLQVDATFFKKSS